MEEHYRVEIRTGPPVTEGPTYHEFHIFRVREANNGTCPNCTHAPSSRRPVVDPFAKYYPPPSGKGTPAGTHAPSSRRPVVDPFATYYPPPSGKGTPAGKVAPPPAPAGKAADDDDMFS